MSNILTYVLLLKGILLYIPIGQLFLQTELSMELFKVPSVSKTSRYLSGMRESWGKDLRRSDIIMKKIIL